MKKIFVDTNIILDLLGKRTPFFNASKKLFTLADKQKIDLKFLRLA